MPTHADTADYFVEIVETETGKVERRMGPMSERRAERVESGVLINLNHEKFHTRTVRDADPR